MIRKMYTDICLGTVVNLSVWGIYYKKNEKRGLHPYSAPVKINLLIY